MSMSPSFREITMTYPSLKYRMRMFSLILGLVVLFAVSRSTPAKASLEAEIEQELREILRSPVLRRALTGVHVRRLRDGKTLFAYNADRLFNPASNMKLLTSATALWYLGPSYRFQTTIRRAKNMRGGVVKGDIYVEARGDPTLTTETMFGLVNQVALGGITKVEGDLIVDDTFFDEVTEGPGWEQEVGDHAYNAPIGAFSVNFNTFVAKVMPGDRVGADAKISIWPPVTGLDSEVTARTRGSRSRTRIWFGTTRTPQDGVRVTVRGSIAIDDTVGRTLRRRIHMPTQFAGEMLKYLLELRGIKITGDVKRGTSEGHRTVAVARWVSRPLSNILSTLNKYSNNFMAEQILKTVAAEVEGIPGTWAKGKTVLERFMVEIGIPAGSFVLGNGSGLNDVNRLTPIQITEILQIMHQRFELAPEFIASLAVAGQSGTINSRFEDSPAISRLRAKTGSLTGVSALSGYVATQDNDVLAFSVMMNDYQGRARNMWKIQEQIGSALAELHTRENLAASTLSTSTERK